MKSDKRFKIEKYREFFDVPRSFIVLSDDRSNYFLFDCPFDDVMDDYPNEYAVYRLPLLSSKELEGDWRKFASGDYEKIGCVPLVCLEFDETRRTSVKVADGIDGIRDLLEF
jgi:hypothetical protein